MNTQIFTSLRRRLDEAITFGAFDKARLLIEGGLRLAHKKELLGEIMYFKAQERIIDGDFSGAIQFLDKAIKYNPQDGAAYNDRALCMVEQGIIDASFDYFDRGIEVEPDYATIYHNKGWLLNKLGHHRESLKYFRKALEIEPGRAVTYENMADAYNHIGCQQQALDTYQQALGLLSDSCDEIKGQIYKQIKKIQKPH